MNYIKNIILCSIAGVWNPVSSHVRALLWQLEEFFAALKMVDTKIHFWICDNYFTTHAHMHTSQHYVFPLFFQI